MARQTTTPYELPFYETASDQPDGATQQEDLAEALNDVIVGRNVGPYASRGEPDKPGQMHVATDMRVASVADGAAWIELQGLPVITRTTNFTFQPGDCARVVEAHSSADLIATIPANTTVAFPVGTVIQVDRMGAGNVEIREAPDVIIHSSGGRRRIRDRYEAISIRKRATNEWVLIGALA